MASRDTHSYDRRLVLVLIQGRNRDIQQPYPYYHLLAHITYVDRTDCMSILYRELDSGDDAWSGSDVGLGGL